MNLIIRNRLSGLAWFLIAIQVLLGIVLLFQPTHPDEKIFMRVARELESGHLPYTTMTDNKPPGIYLTMAILDDFLGNQVWAYRLVFLMINVAGAGFIFLTGRKLFKVEIGLVGGYTYLTLIALFHGSYALTEPPVAAIAAVLIWMFTESWGQLSGKKIFLMGILTALATTYKQPAVSLVIIVLVILSYGLNNFWAVLKRWSWFGLGFGLIWLINGVIFQTQDALMPMLRATVTDNFSQYPPGNPATTITFSLFRIILPTLGIFITVVWGLIKRIPPNHRYWGYLGGMMMTVPWMIYRPYHHYWVLIIPLVTTWLMDIFYVQSNWIKIVIINDLIIALAMLGYSLGHLVI